MAVVAGTEGLVTFATGYSTKIVSWDVTAEAAILDATGMGDSWDRKLGGRKTWNGNITAKWDSTSTTDRRLGGGNATAFFRFSDATTDGTIGGKIIVSNINFSVGIDDANNISFTFMGDGTMSVVEASS